LKLSETQNLRSFESTEHFLFVALVEGIEIHIFVEAFERLFDVGSMLLMLELVIFIVESVG